MEKITLPKASVLTSPNPVTLVCTRKPDGTTNLATVSWWTYLSYNPGMIAYAMAKTSYSGEMVRQNKKVILTIPGEAIAKEVIGSAHQPDVLPIKSQSSVSRCKTYLILISAYRCTAGLQFSVLSKSTMKREIITSISVTWTRYLEMKMKRPFLPGKATAKFVRQSRFKGKFLYVS